MTPENRAGATLDAIQGAKEYLKQLDDEQGGFDCGQSNERNFNSDPAAGRP